MPDFNPSAAGLPQLQAPQNAFDIAQNIATNDAQNQMRQAQTAGAMNELQQKQRGMQLSMLNGILTEPDPEKQRDLISKIVPIANRLNPSYQIDKNIDVPTIRALVQSQHPLDNMPPTAYLQNEGQGLSPLIKSGLQSGQLSLKDVVSAQASNPFMNIGNATGDAAGAMPQMNPAAGPGMPTSVPTDYNAQLSQLPASMQPTVKAIIEGRETPPSPNSRAPGAAALMQAVNMVDPNFDFTNAGKRQSTAKDFASGASANNVMSLNTLAGHLGSLEKAWSGLNNTAGITPLSNTLSTWANQAEAGTGQSGTLKSFNIAKSAVSDELSKLLKGGVVSDTEKKEWEASIDNGASPEAQKAALSEISGIIESRLEALNNKYHEGMGPVNVNKNWATPKSKAVFDKLQGRETIAPGATGQAQQLLQQPGGAGAQAQSKLKQPAQGTSIIKSQAEFDSLPSGAIYFEPDGQKYRKP